MKLTGSIAISPALSAEQVTYLTRFSQARRMARTRGVEQAEDPTRDAVGLPVGAEGEYFVGGDRAGVADVNRAPAGQPSLWCCWCPSDDGSRLTWKGCESDPSLYPWIAYLVEHFLIPWGITVNGCIDCHVENWARLEESGGRLEFDAIARIIINNNQITAQRAVLTYEDC